MPDENTSSSGDNNALKPDSGVTIPRLSLAEQGFVGLRVRNHRIQEEMQLSFRYPYYISTVNEMRHSPTVGAAMNVYKFMMSRVQWSLEAPVGATDVEKERVRVVNTMLDDMEGTWGEFISSVIPYLEYGFAINEMVLRRRLYKNGSKFNDGLVGIRKLAPRSQDTIDGWVFDDSGNDLVAVKQSLRYIENGYKYANRTDPIDGRLTLPVEKLLIFTASKNKGNPEGNSLYKNIFLAHKQLTLLQEQQLLSVTKDIQGILKIEIPPKYLDPAADAGDKAVVQGFQTIIDNYNNGTQRGLLVPKLIDPDSKLPLFTYELMESKGSPRNNIESIIKGLQTDILSALSVDVLRLGADGTGSFSLAESKSSILSMAVSSRLQEIADTLSKLVRVIYSQNGWEITNLPKFKYEEIEEVDIGTFSSAIQRIFSTSAIEVDRPVLNRVRKMLGIPERDVNEPVDVDNLPANLSGNSSKSGAGMAVGTSGSGTAKDPFGSGDTSVSNKEN